MVQWRRRGGADSWKTGVFCKEFHSGGSAGGGGPVAVQEAFSQQLLEDGRGATDLRRESAHARHETEMHTQRHSATRQKSKQAVEVNCS